jgi:hypothetical protein
LDVDDDDDDDDVVTVSDMIEEQEVSDRGAVFKDVAATVKAELD